MVRVVAGNGFCWLGEVAVGAVFVVGAAIPLAIGLGQSYNNC